MFKSIANLLLNAIALYIVSQLLRGITIATFSSAFVAVVVISILNLFVKPVLLFLTLPINILTLGLFTFVLNAVLFILASNITPGFDVDGLGTAILGSIILSVVISALNMFVR